VFLGGSGSTLVIDSVNALSTSLTNLDCKAPFVTAPAPDFALDSSVK
jgi:hypothetical protein